jgi:hypothetical protein
MRKHFDLVGREAFVLEMDNDDGERLAYGQGHRLRQGPPAPRKSRARPYGEVFEEERPKLIAYRGRFDGFHAQQASVSKTRLVRFDNNKSMTCRRLQLRAKAQDPQRPYALRVRLQTMDNRA